ncbi:MAG: DUF3852 family protein [Oscillospiraceae bacterium]|nr:DUF3852 family protein [Oscillospiraceae bacterium]
MENPWGYRNKGHFQVGRRQGKIKLGFFAEGSHCLAAKPCQHLFSPKVTSLVAFLEELLTAYQVKVAEAGILGLRYVLLRESQATGEILVVLIYSGLYSDKKEDIAREISRKYPEVVGVCQNKNTRAAGTVAGAIESTWNEASGQIKTVVNKVVFPAIDLILAVFFFAKLGTAYFDYRKHGQFEWAAPAILFACLVFTLTAPLYIWQILA